MKNILELIQNNHRKISMFLCCIAIIHHSWMVKNTDIIGKDKSFQITAAQMMVEGRGMSLPRASYNNLSDTFYEKLVGWPPGYVLLYAIPHALGIEDVFLKAIILDFFAIAIFFVACFFLLELLTYFLTPLGKIGLWVYWAIFYSPIEDCESSGRLAIAFLYLGLSYVIYCLKINKTNIRSGIIGGIIVSLCFLMRYAYWPLVIVLPMCILIYWMRSRENIKNYFFGLTFSSIIILIGISLFLNIYLGSTTYLEDYDHGTEVLSGVSNKNLHLDNLKKIQPFPAYTFGFQHGWYKILKMGLPLNWSVAGHIIFSIIIFSICVYSLILLFDKKLNYSPLNFVLGMFLLGISSLTLAMISYLAVSYFGEFGSIYMSDIRYYVPIYPIASIILFGIYFNIKTFKINRGIRFLGLSLFILNIIGVGIWRAKTLKFYLLNNERNPYHSDIYPIKKYMEENNDLQIPIFMAHASNNFAAGSVFGGKIYNPEIISFDSLKTEKPVKVLLFVRDNAKDPYKTEVLRYVSKHHATLSEKSINGTFYKFKIPVSYQDFEEDY